MIMRSILSMLLVQAIKAGNTLAGQDRVFDALAGNIIKDKAHHCAPIAIVNADDTNYPTSLSEFRGKTDQTFMIDLAVLYADKKAAQQPDRMKWQLPHSDPGAQIYMSRLERGVLLALQPASSPAAQHFYDGFGQNLTGLKSLIGGNRKDGVRFAARQIQLAGKMRPEPPPNAQPEVWAFKALGFLKSIPETKRHAELLEADLKGDADAPARIAELAQLGLSDEQANLLGIPSFAPSDQEFTWLPIDGIDPSDKVID